MGRHQRDLEFDPDGLRPPTVEELAAQERAGEPKPETGGKRKPLLVALSTSALLAAGASAFALARSEEPAVLVEPSGVSAPFGVGYKDGFGEHTPRPSLSPAPAKPVSKKPVAQSPYVPPAPEAPPTLGTLNGQSVAPSSSAAPSKGDVVAASLTAVYWEMTFQDRYWVYVWVNNAGKEPATWQVNLKLPKNAKVTSVWAVNKTTKPDGTITLSAPRGTLGPGRTYLFAIEGVSIDPFKLQNCTVNGVTCAPF